MPFIIYFLCPAPLFFIPDDKRSGKGCRQFQKASGVNPLSAKTQRKGVKDFVRRPFP